MICKEIVRGEWRSHQCGNKAKNDGYCGIHHPDKVAERKAKSDAKYKANMKVRAKMYSIDFIKSMKKIRDGEVDPKEEAIKILNHYEVE